MKVTWKHEKLVLKKEYVILPKCNNFLFLNLDGDLLGVHFMLLGNIHRVAFAHLLGFMFIKRQNEINQCMGDDICYRQPAQGLLL